MSGRLYAGGEFGAQAQVGSEEEADYLDPGLLEQDQVAALLRRRLAEQQAALRRSGGDGAGSGNGAPNAGQRSTYEQLSVLRRELNGLVAAWHHRTGKPHGGSMPNSVRRPAARPLRWRPPTSCGPGSGTAALRAYRAAFDD